MKPFIEKVFKSLERVEGIRPRPSQVDMALSVAQALMAPSRPLAVQAPTGTGKTLAYLVGILAARNAGMSRPVMVATSTKALQEQLLTVDAPKLLSTGYLTPGELMTLKGRQNYACVRLMDAYVEGLSEIDENLMLQSIRASVEPWQVQDMLDTLQDKTWDGDFDNLSIPIEGRLTDLSAQTKTCVRESCPRYRECPYYRRRSNIKNCSIVVINQDLLLTMGVPENIHILVDEAHHFPEKALTHLSRSLNLGSFLRNLSDLQVLKPVYKALGASAGFDLLPLSDMASAARSVSEALKRKFPVLLEETLISAELENKEFPGLAILCALSYQIMQSLSSLQKEDRVRNSTDLLWRVYMAQTVIEPVYSACEALTDKHDWVRWLDLDYCLHAAPWNIGEELREKLWNYAFENSTSMIFVSATLKTLDSFDPYLRKLGLPEARSLELPYVLPYEKSTLRVPKMQYTPRQSELKLYEQELVEMLPKEIGPEEGTLLLLSSWKQLKELTPVLKKHLGAEHVLVQGEKPVKALVAEHQKRIDSGKGSLLVGLATLAEGLDLPGEYCSHVIISKLPFSVPTSALERELQKRLGAQYFEAHALPEATRKLTQATGRLVRRETDVGRITVFDPRLVKMGYGRKMLKSLPPFTIISS